MTPKSRLFQASFSETLLWSAAIALIVLASPARADTVTLLCANEPHGNSFTLQVDYDQKLVALLNSDGTAQWTKSAR